MGVTESVERVSTSVVAALASSPVVLALVIFNVIYLIFAIYQGRTDSEARAQLTTEMLHSQAQERDRWKELVETAMKWCPSPEKKP